MGALGRYAVVFPGQGSQAVGMGWPLAQAYPEAAGVLALAEEVVPGLSRLMAQGPEEELRRTANTQPAVMAASLMAWRAWEKEGAPPPAAAAGHSLGEYTALVAAGALDERAGLALVRVRGELMEQALPAGQGGMAAVVGLEDRAVEQLCTAVARRLGGPVPAVVAANYNAPGQVVVSGRREALEQVQAEVQQAGGRYLPLPVSGPFHSPFMAEAARAFEAHLDATPFAAPRWPVYSNVTATPFVGDGQAIRRLLSAQLTSPVRWAEAVSAMAALGITHFVELGPGRVLSGLVRRIVPQAVALPVSDPASLQAALARLRKDGIA